MNKKILTILATLLIAIALPSTSHAVLFFSADTGLSSFEGSFEYTSTSATTAEVEIEVTNTSSATNGGFITALAFNNPLDLISGVTLSATDGDFGLLGEPSFDNTINGVPYGQYDIGASTGSNWLGGGNPTLGIAVGSTETFIFSLTGVDLDTLTEKLFADELSTNDSPGLIVRLRGFDDGRSDKVPVNWCEEKGQCVTTPEPMTMILFGSGMVGAVLRRKFS